MKTKNLDVLLDNIMDAVENCMDYYLGYEREETIEEINNHLKEIFSSIKIELK
jgi:hypothetical protein